MERKLEGALKERAQVAAELKSTKSLLSITKDSLDESVSQIQSFTKNNEELKKRCEGNLSRSGAIL